MGAYYPDRWSLLCSTFHFTQRRSPLYTRDLEMCKLHLSNTLTNKTPIKFCQREAQERQLKAEERKHYFSLFLLSSSSAFVVMNSGKQRQTSECPLKKQVSSSVDGNQTVSSVRWTTSAGLVSSSAPRRYCGSRPATVAGQTHAAWFPRGKQRRRLLVCSWFCFKQQQQEGIFTVCSLSLRIVTTFLKLLIGKYLTFSFFFSNVFNILKIILCITFSSFEKPGETSIFLSRHKMTDLKIYTLVFFLFIFFLFGSAYLST